MADAAVDDVGHELRRPRASSCARAASTSSTCSAIGTACDAELLPEGGRVHDRDREVPGLELERRHVAPLLDARAGRARCRRSASRGFDVLGGDSGEVDAGDEGGGHRWTTARARAARARATQSTGWTGRASTACHVAASVSPLGGRPRAVCRSISACSVAAPKTPSTGTAGGTPRGAPAARRPRRPWRPCRARPARVGQRRPARAPAAASAAHVGGAGGLPAPPRQAAGAVGRPDLAEALRCRPASGTGRSGRAARSARRRCGCAPTCCALTASTVPPMSFQ